LRDGHVSCRHGLHFVIGAGDSGDMERDVSYGKSLVLFGGQKVHRCTFWPPNKTSDFDTVMRVTLIIITYTQWATLV